MTGAELMAVVGFGMTVFGFMFALWRYIEGKILAVRTEAGAAAAASTALATLAREELAAQKLHVAEHYVSKAGLKETTEQIMEAISGVKAAVDNMTMRVDRIVEGQARRTTTR